MWRTCVTGLFFMHLLQAYAGQRFASRLLEAMKGKKDVVECTFVQNDITAAPFFSTRVCATVHKVVVLPSSNVLVYMQCRLGPNGVEEILPVGDISPFEKDVMDKMVTDLVAQAKKGVEFVSKAQT